MEINELPHDPMILFSYVNMRLRDDYESLDAMCEDMDLNKKELLAKMKESGFEYNQDQNKFW